MIIWGRWGWAWRWGGDYGWSVYLGLIQALFSHQKAQSWRSAQLWGVDNAVSVSYAVNFTFLRHAHKCKNDGCHRNWAKIVGEAWRRVHTLINTQTLTEAEWFLQNRYMFFFFLWLLSIFCSAPVSPFTRFALRLFHTICVSVYCTCVRWCDLLTARLIPQRGVFVWLPSSSRGLEAATCSSIIVLLFALQSWFFSAMLYVVHIFTLTHAASQSCESLLVWF